MAHVLYALSGQGRGHTSRGLAVAAGLRARGHRVTFCGGGTARAVLEAGGEPVVPSPTLRQVMRWNRLLLLTTGARNAGLVLRARRVVDGLEDAVRALGVDLVVSDFDAFAWRAADRLGLPVVTVDHQQVVTETRPDPPVVDPFSQFVASQAVRRIVARRPVRRLILDVEKWPKNTRLAKAIAKRGLDLECKELTAGRAAAFLTRAAKDEFDTALPRDAADLLVQFAGTDLGLLEQELGKLCSFAADRDPRAVTAEDVVELVGDSSIRNVFAMLGDVRRGDLGGALAELDKLLAAGEAPFKILGGLGFAVRKLAAAADVAIGGGSLPAGLAAAGVFPKERGESEAYLKRIGRGRAAKLRGLLLDADGDLRGGSALPDRAVLERLLVELAGPTKPLRR